MIITGVGIDLMLAQTYISVYATDVTIVVLACKLARCIALHRYKGQKNNFMTRALTTVSLAGRCYRYITLPKMLSGFHW